MIIDQHQRFIANKFPQTLKAQGLNIWIAKKKFLRELDRSMRKYKLKKRRNEIYKIIDDQGFGYLYQHDKELIEIDDKLEKL